MKPQATFGPTVTHNDDGSFTAWCQRGPCYCFRSVGNACIAGFGGVREREIPKDRKTPDWCEWRAGAIADVRNHLNPST